jgi:hypothetical protein
VRKGIFPGKILLVNERTEKLIRYGRFVAEFDEEYQIMPYDIDMGECVFPNDGLFRFEVYFAIQGTEVLKGEFSLEIIASEV